MIPLSSTIRELYRRTFTQITRKSKIWLFLPNTLVGISATGVGLLGCALRDFEAERVERYDGWRRQAFV
jgi:hypothetical protein